MTAWFVELAGYVLVFSSFGLILKFWPKSKAREQRQAFRQDATFEYRRQAEAYRPKRHEPPT